MINDKNHADLRNKMSPVVNYFDMVKKFDKTTDEETKKILSKFIEKEKKNVNRIMPSILKILKADE